MGNDQFMACDTCYGAKVLCRGCQHNREAMERLLRANEAARRYFEHCRRVSLSARHAGCDSGEMGVRLALMKEADDALSR